MSYTAQRSITIDHTKCGSNDSVNMPVLVSGVYAYLATVAHGGSVTSTLGYDIVFTSDSAGLNILNWEIESYDPVTGTVNIWIQVPTVSHTVDTVFYIWYGNAAVTSLQSAGGSVWYDPTDAARYSAVYHFSGNPPSFLDSTFSGNTQTGSGVTAVTGQIDGAAAFNGSTDYRSTDPYFTLGNTAVSLEAWVNSATLTTQSFGMIICWDPLNANFQIKADTGNILLKGGDSSFIFTPCPTNNAWHHIVGTIDAAGNGKIYIDGALAVSGTIHAPGSTPDNLEIGRYGSGGGGAYFSGDIDEVRVAGNVFSPDWILTEYNNQSSPSTFYTVGSAVVPPAGPTRPTYTWPTRIQKQAAAGISDGTVTQIPLTLTLPQWVSVGDLIIVFCQGTSPGALSWTISDNLSNTYTESEFDDNSGGTGDSRTPMFWSVATTAGICSITVGGTMDQLILAVAVYGSNAPPLSQGCSVSGFWPPANLLLGFQMQPVPTANSLFVSSLYGAAAPVTVQSDTGDALVQSSGLDVPADHVNHTLTQWDRFISTAGGSTVPANLWFTSGSQANGGTAAIFSKPLTRPGGLATQYAARPGLGGAVFFGPQTSVSTCFPYIPSIGSLLVVGVTTANGVGLAMTVSDTYGNTYTRQILYDGTNGSLGQSQAAIYTCIVTNVPSNVEAFKITAAFTGTSGQLNHPCAIYAAEYAALGTVGTITGYNFASTTGSSTNLMKTAIASVAGNSTLQVAVLVGTSFVSSPFPLTVSPGTGLVTQLALVNPSSTPGMSSYPNVANLGIGALMDQFITSPGMYDAEATINANGGAIVMITIPYTVTTITLLCPLTNTARVGESFSTFMQVSGGIAPYTFVITLGALPPGLVLNSLTGQISGIPSVAGSYSFTVQVTDSLGNSATVDAPCPLTVIAGPEMCILPPATGQENLVLINEPLENQGT